MPEPRSFHLGDILTVTIGGRLVSPNGIGGVYTILGFMTDSSPMTHQLPRLVDECRPSLMAQHPDLAQVQPPDEFDDEAHVLSWLHEQVDRFGETRMVAPLPPGDHTDIDPFTEWQMKTGRPVDVAVVVPDA